MPPGSRVVQIVQIAEQIARGRGAVRALAERVRPRAFARGPRQPEPAPPTRLLSPRVRDGLAVARAESYSFGRRRSNAFGVRRRALALCALVEEHVRAPLPVAENLRLARPPRPRVVHLPPLAFCVAGFAGRASTVADASDVGVVVSAVHRAPRVHDDGVEFVRGAPGLGGVGRDAAGEAQRRRDGDALGDLAPVHVEPLQVDRERRGALPETRPPGRGSHAVARVAPVEVVRVVEALGRHERVQRGIHVPPVATGDLEAGVHERLVRIARRAAVIARHATAKRPLEHALHERGGVGSNPARVENHAMRRGGVERRQTVRGMIESRRAAAVRDAALVHASQRQA